MKESESFPNVPECAPDLPKDQLMRFKDLQKFDHNVTCEICNQKVYLTKLALNQMKSGLNFSAFCDVCAKEYKEKITNDFKKSEEFQRMWQCGSDWGMR